MIFTDTCYITVALFGAEFPEFRFLAYNIVGICAIKLMKAVRKDNIANCLQKTAIVTFEAKCDTIGLLGGCIGSALIVAVLEIVNVDVTVSMIIEASVCICAHVLQYYANIKVKFVKQKILGEAPDPEYSFSEVLNDLFKGKSNKKQDTADDSIFDN